MAHDVKFIIPERDLGKADVEFKVRKDGELLGTLRVSNGAVEWAEKKAKYAHKISWVALVDLIKINGTHPKK